jgi:hypothetical protein
MLALDRSFALVLDKGCFEADLMELLNVWEFPAFFYFCYGLKLFGKVDVHQFF